MLLGEFPIRRPVAKQGNSQLCALNRQGKPRCSLVVERIASQPKLPCNLQPATPGTRPDQIKDIWQIWGRKRRQTSLQNFITSHFMSNTEEQPPLPGRQDIGPVPPVGVDPEVLAKTNFSAPEVETETVRLQANHRSTCLLPQSEKNFLIIMAWLFSRQRQQHSMCQISMTPGNRF